MMDHETASAHPDFNLPWVKTLLAGPDIEYSQRAKNRGKDVSHSMFEYTLYTERGIRAQLSFRRPTKEPDAIVGWESCFLLSLGDGLDGRTGRSHGGLNALILDDIMGTVASRAGPDPVSPATATMTIDYKAPIDTPGVILARAWAIELSGRKVWVRAVLEDGEKKVLCAGKALFIAARQPGKL